ncbi:hypothetical protein GGI64_005597 [Rhizobium leguminosarum]|uniref:Uncharacterized protein n=1 Tax=Rhizobium leguminosarum TaxID=384 RepID=A0A7Z0E4R5_RHILE|nr:hypothetical protein [Rhizobium leguminosarum]
MSEGGAAACPKVTIDALVSSPYLLPIDTQSDDSKR